MRRSWVGLQRGFVHAWNGVTPPSPIHTLPLKGCFLSDGLRLETGIRNTRLQILHWRGGQMGVICSSHGVHPTVDSNADYDLSSPGRCASHHEVSIDLGRVRRGVSLRVRRGSIHGCPWLALGSVVGTSWVLVCWVVPPSYDSSQCTYRIIS